MAYVSLDCRQETGLSQAQVPSGEDRRKLEEALLGGHSRRVGQDVHLLLLGEEHRAGGVRLRQARG
jgi:hypothetical protein